VRISAQSPGDDSLSSKMRAPPSEVVTRHRCSVELPRTNLGRDLAREDVPRSSSNSVSARMKRALSEYRTGTVVCVALDSLFSCAQMTIRKALQAQPKYLALLEAYILVSLIGFLDSINGWDISLFLFYAAPIVFVAWYCERVSAIICAVVCGLVWFWANYDTQPYAAFHAYVWAAFNRTMYFLFVAIGGSAMRREREASRSRLEAMIRARELEQEIVRVSEEEQMRIGQDLHDGLCQELLAIDCAAACLKADLEAKALPEAQTAGELQQMLRDAAIGARDLARGIFPVQMDSEGLLAALEDLVAKAGRLPGLEITFEADGDVGIHDPQAAMHLYRIAQQALSNALAHANAKRITIGLRREGTHVIMTAIDDGSGLSESQSSSRGIGLRTMQYRARLIGAELVLESAPNEGTEVRCVIPIPPCHEHPTPRQ